MKKTITFLIIFTMFITFVYAQNYEEIIEYGWGQGMNSSNPCFVDAHNNLGVCYFDKGRIDEAISHFQHAIKIDSNHVDAHYNLGLAYGSKGKHDMAFREMKIARRLSSSQQWKKIAGGIKGEKGSVPAHPIGFKPVKQTNAIYESNETEVTC